MHLNMADAFCTEPRIVCRRHPPRCEKRFPAQHVRGEQVRLGIYRRAVSASR